MIDPTPLELTTEKSDRLIAALATEASIVTMPDLAGTLLLAWASQVTDPAEA